MRAGDESFDHRAQGPVLKRHDHNRPRPDRQVKRQGNNIVIVGIEPHDRSCKDGEIRACCYQTRPKRYGHRDQCRFRETEPSFLECLQQADVIPCSAARQNPGLIDQFSEVDFASASPATVGTGGNKQSVIEQRLRIQVVHQVFIGWWRAGQPHEHAIIFPIT